VVAVRTDDCMPCCVKASGFGQNNSFFFSFQSVLYGVRLSQLMSKCLSCNVKMSRFVSKGPMCQSVLCHLMSKCLVSCQIVLLCVKNILHRVNIPCIPLYVFIPCKIMEKVVRDSVFQHLKDNNLLSDCQHGFVSNR
jgi:hypothetical protein